MLYKVDMKYCLKSVSYLLDGSFIDSFFQTWRLFSNYIMNLILYAWRKLWVWSCDLSKVCGLFLWIVSIILSKHNIVNDVNAKIFQD